MNKRSITIPTPPADTDDRVRPTGSAPRVLLVTGMSGAGKSSALKLLEDMGYEAVDNIPLSLLESLVVPPEPDLGDEGLRAPLAIGVDIRTRDFAIDSIIRKLDRLIEVEGIEVKVLFLDCDDDELRKRYTETRRRHPLAVDRAVSDGIATERRLIYPLRDRADITLDTTNLLPADLKLVIQGQFALERSPGLSLFITSFSFRKGLPRAADLVFDVRFLRNPHYEAALRPFTGRDKEVADYIVADGGFEGFFTNLTALLLPLLPRYAAEGKSYFTIAIGCTGGRHRSVFVAGKLAAWLEEQGQTVHLHHRDVDI